MIQDPPLLYFNRPAMNIRLIKFGNPHHLRGFGAVVFFLEWESYVVPKNAPVLHQESLDHFETFAISFIVIFLPVHLLTLVL